MVQYQRDFNIYWAIKCQSLQMYRELRLQKYLLNVYGVWLGDLIEKNKMDRACSTYGEGEMHTGF
jgi:hypothetical protein